MVTCNKLLRGIQLRPWPVSLCMNHSEYDLSCEGVSLVQCRQVRSYLMCWSNCGHLMVQVVIPDPTH
jgi:hypothetical protein